MEYVEGGSRWRRRKSVVTAELRRHLATLHNIKSSCIGGPSDDGVVIPPYPVMRATDPSNKDTTWPRRTAQSGEKEYVFCHNDLSQRNVIVDPVSLKIRAIVDGEHGGFWPEEFEMAIWERLGPSVALEGEGERDDVGAISRFLDGSQVTTSKWKSL